MADKKTHVFRLDYDIGNSAGFAVCNWLYLYLTLGLFARLRERCYDQMPRDEIPLGMRNCANELMSHFGVEFPHTNSPDPTWLIAHRNSLIFTYLFNIIDTMIHLSCESLAHFTSQMGLAFEIPDAQLSPPSDSLITSKKRSAPTETPIVEPSTAEVVRTTPKRRKRTEPKK
jgi:hypothetical protein